MSSLARRIGTLLPPGGDPFQDATGNKIDQGSRKPSVHTLLSRPMLSPRLVCGHKALCFEASQATSGLQRVLAHGGTAHA